MKKWLLLLPVCSLLFLAGFLKAGQSMEFLTSGQDLFDAGKSVVAFDTAFKAPDRVEEAEPDSDSIAPPACPTFLSADGEPVPTWQAGSIIEFTFDKFMAEPTPAPLPTVIFDGINVLINGRRVTFIDQPPVIKNDRVLVPLRVIAEHLGAIVQWHPGDNSVELRRGDKKVLLTIGGNLALVGSGGLDRTLELDVPPVTVNNRTMVPLRLIAQVFEMQVDWHKATQTVIISSY